MWKCLDACLTFVSQFIALQRLLYYICCFISFNRATTPTLHNFSELALLFTFTHLFIVLCRHVFQQRPLKVHKSRWHTEYMSQPSNVQHSHYVWLTHFCKAFNFPETRNGFQWPFPIFPPKCTAVASVDSCFGGRTNLSCRWGAVHGGWWSLRFGFS